MTIIRRFWWAIAIILVIVFGVVYALWPIQPDAVAQINLESELGAVKTGQQLERAVIIQSGVKVNAVDMTMKYAPDELEVVNVSTKQVRFDMVIFQPKVDASGGTVRFTQATTNPFSGQDGRVAVVTFKAKKDGKPQVHFEGKIVANDAKGTDVSVKPAAKPRWKVWLGR